MNTQKQITRIKTLIERLEAGETVSTRALSRVLTESQMTTLSEEWESEKSSRKVQKPKAIKKYEALIKNAILLYGRGDRMCFEKAPHHKIRAMCHKAENAFELALEHLSEAIDSDSSLRLWIDRDLREAECDPIGIPRVIGSSSFECQSKLKVPFPTFTKRQFKVFALEQALEALEPKPIESEDKSVTFLCPPRKMPSFEGFIY
jgi:ferritin-like metal-binding protein YciE